MAAIRVDSLGTVNQRGENTTIFGPGDALALTIDITASQDLATPSDPQFMGFFEAVFQIIDPLSDTVVVNETWLSAFEWGPDFWISMGNNWGPAEGDFDTPRRWGLRVTQDAGNVFGFRAIVKAYTVFVPEGGAGEKAFDVSPVRWFLVTDW